MKPLRKTLRILLLTASLALAAALPVAAQTYKTNDLSLPFSVVTAGVSSNTIGWGNSGGWAAATGYQFVSRDSLDTPWQAIVSFSCPTVTLAAASFTFGFSVDGSTYVNTPAGTHTLIVPASASSGSLTNYTAVLNGNDTNLVGRIPPRLNGITLLSVTNGNAANLTINRITIRERY